MLDFAKFELLTFDCFGTLIDWETGISKCLQPIIKSHGIEISDDELLEKYARFESELETGSYSTYKAVLTAVVQNLGNDLGFQPVLKEYQALPASLPHWPPFPDTVDSLRRLHRRFKLGVISNVDNDLFVGTMRTLGVSFDWIVTAEKVRAYKPSPAVFEYALKTFGLPREKILHVAQSLYHDIVPAKALGLSTVWVNRRHDKEGTGATLPAQAQPDIEVPDLNSLVELTG
jgi:2-haloacid dehalogenase